MIDHVSVAVRDLAAATRFYEAVLGALGYTKLDDAPGDRRLRQAIFRILDQSARRQPRTQSDRHACLPARAQQRRGRCLSRRRARSTAAASTARRVCAPQHGDGYYAAFIRDPDGNRIEAVTFSSK